MSEPDYEQIMADRDEERGERYLVRMDNEFGRVEDYLTNGWTVEAVVAERWTKWSEWVDRATAEAEVARARGEGLTARIVRAS